MDRHGRLMRVLDVIVERGALRVEDLVDELNVSPATVRRDIDTLASQQIITRTRGGAASSQVSGEVPIRYRHAVNGIAKEKIAKLAASQVEPGDVVGINGGTTTTDIAREIALRVATEKKFEDSSVTIVTNAINIANELVVRPQLQVVVVGGMVMPKSYEIVGAISEIILPAISIKHLFLGVVALDPKRGVFNNDVAEAKINAALVNSAEKVTVVADSSKLNSTAFAKICDFDELHELITNGPIDSRELEILENTGLKVLQA